MEIPENCRECEYDNVCTSAHYGSSMCKHEEEIRRRAVTKILGKDEKDGAD